jgi:hypothetical protein
VYGASAFCSATNFVLRRRRVLLIPLAALAVFDLILVRFFCFLGSWDARRPAERGASASRDQICSAATACSPVPLAIVDVFDSELVGLVCFFGSWDMLIDPQSAVRRRLVTKFVLRRRRVRRFLLLSFLFSIQNSRVSSASSFRGILIERSAVRERSGTVLLCDDAMLVDYSCYSRCFRFETRVILLLLRFLGYSSEQSAACQRSVTVYSSCYGCCFRSKNS